MWASTTLSSYLSARPLTAISQWRTTWERTSASRPPPTSKTAWTCISRLFFWKNTFIPKLLSFVKDVTRIPIDWIVATNYPYKRKIDWDLCSSIWIALWSFRLYLRGHSDNTWHSRGAWVRLGVTFLWQVNFFATFSSDFIAFESKKSCLIEQN